VGRWFLRAGLIIGISWPLSYLPTYITDRLFAAGFLNTIYMVIGIMFPLGLNQIISFSFTEVERDAFVKRYRSELSGIRNTFVCLFAISTLVFLVKSIYFIIDWNFISFDFRFLYLVFLLFCLIYYVFNFISLAKLKNEIEDKIREGKKVKESEQE